MNTKTKASRRRIGVITRSPYSPRIKSRLSAEIGQEKARCCYNELLSNTLQCASNFDSTVYVDGPIEDRNWLLGLPHKPQRVADLGQRMLACFEDGTNVLVGGDSPLMSIAYLENALDSLLSHDLVLGPTDDGGYVLIGMNEPIPELFENIPWSTEKVLSATTEVANALDLSVKCLDQVWDVDTEADYIRWLDLRRK
ncbi:MAG: TIGR04282 family arsenosugar biosynthesis glycosyltransferase [Gammaproteobacteria bacterium]|nr:TIGR04282 family arsenosugar biosynthesis glycosyltransferase [Gammaproteobacteria bacterium]